MILAGDIGGTNTRLALFGRGAEGLRIRFEKTFPSRERPSLESALEEFLSLHPAEITGPPSASPARCATGAARRPTSPGWSTPRAWRDACASSASASSTTWSRTPTASCLLGSRDFVTLNKGARNASGNRALISAGTGLGEAGLLWDGRAHSRSRRKAGTRTSPPATASRWSCSST